MFLYNGVLLQEIPRLADSLKELYRKVLFLWEAKDALELPHGPYNNQEIGKALNPLEFLGYYYSKEVLIKFKLMFLRFFAKLI